MDRLLGGLGAACGEVGLMGMVIRFPLEERIAHDARRAVTLIEPASIIILPVVRVERASDEPTGGCAPGSGNSPGRGRRRRGTPS